MAAGGRAGSRTSRGRAWLPSGRQPVRGCIACRLMQMTVAITYELMHLTPKPAGTLWAAPGASQSEAGLVQVWWAGGWGPGRKPFTGTSIRTHPRARAHAHAHAHALLLLPQAIKNAQQTVIAQRKQLVADVLKARSVPSDLSRRVYNFFDYESSERRKERGGGCVKGACVFVASSCGLSRGPCLKRRRLRVN